MGEDKDNIQVYELEAHKELSVEIRHPSESIKIELLDGNAEIFGVEMIRNEIRSFTSSFAVFTWGGCTVKVKGFASRVNTASQNSVIHDFHLRLQESRVRARKKGVVGPILLVAGPTDVGKSTLTRCLLNYAVRSGNHPLFVDLDVGQSSISIPGTLGILPVDCPGDIVKGYNDKKLSVYFYGYKSPGFNILLYLLLINKLSKTLQYRMQDSAETRSSGAVIDTCGWVTGQGYKSILHAAKSFQINTLLVLDDRELYSCLRHDLSNSVEVVFFDRLDGVVMRNQNVRINRRNRLIYEYFYGSDFPLKPYLFDIKYSEIEIVRMNCMPGRVSKDMYDNPHKYLFAEKISFGPDLLNQILALSYADSVDDVITMSVLGFVCVKDIDVNNQIIKILSPNPEPLPNKLFIMGDIQFKDSCK